MTFTFYTRIKTLYILKNATYRVFHERSNTTALFKEDLIVQNK